MLERRKEPLISVLVCTRNRGAALADMLQSVVDMEVPADLNWELILVDNGSSDGTADVIDSFKARLPLNNIFEGTAGLSFARNTGVEAARGQYILWTDDDVRVSRHWLAAYAKAFETHPDGVYFGGPIIPRFEGEMPVWMAENIDLVGSAFAKRDLGDVFRPFTGKKGDNPFGANFALRAAEQKKLAYPTYLGVSPKFKRVGEEVSVLRQIISSGAAGYWIPEASVEHMIPQSRQSIKYLLDFRSSIGETWIVLSERNVKNFIDPPLILSARMFAGAPVWIWRKTVVSWASFRIRRVFNPASQWLPALLEYGYYKGALNYLRQRAKQ